MRAILIGLFAISATVFLGFAPPKGAQKTNAVADIAASLERPNSQDPKGTVDGALTPNLIPDDVAYSLFFNFVADRETSDEITSLSSYMRYHGLGDIDVEALRAVANGFARASQIISQNRASLSLASLNHRKAILVNETVSSLPDRIGKPGAERVRRHVIEYMKPKVKIIPGPSVPSITHQTHLDKFRR